MDGFQELQMCCSGGYSWFEKGPGVTRASVGRLVDGCSSACQLLVRSWPTRWLMMKKANPEALSPKDVSVGSWIEGY